MSEILSKNIENKFGDIIRFTERKNFLAKQQEIIKVYENLYKKLDKEKEFAKRLSYVTDAIEQVFYLVNGEAGVVGKTRKVSIKRIKKRKKWKKKKKNKQR